MLALNVATLQKDVYLFGVGENWLQFAQEYLCAHLLVEVLDLQRDFFRLQPLDRLDENFYCLPYLAAVYIFRSHILTNTLLGLRIKDTLELGTFLFRCIPSERRVEGAYCETYP